MLGHTFALAIAGSAFQGLDGTVTFEARAERLELLLPKLSKATGLKLRHTPATEDEILVVSVERVKVRELMDRIEDVLYATWKEKDGQWFLHADEKAFAAAVDAEQKARVTSMQKEISQHRADILGNGFGPDAAKKYLRDLGVFRALAENSEVERPVRNQADMMLLKAPGGRALMRVIESLGAATLASVPVSTRIVFSSSPNQFQRPIPNADDILAKLREEQSVWASVMASSGFDLATVSDPFDPRGHSAHLEGPLELRAEVTDIKRRYGTQVVLRVLDQRGKEVLTSYMRLYGASVTRPAKPPTERPTELWKPSNLSAQYVSILGEYDSKTPLDKKWLDRISRPDLYDPLSYAASDFLIDYAKAVGRQVVANPADTLHRIWEGSTMNQPLYRVKQTVEASLDMQFDEVGGWLIAKPFSISFERANRDNRRASAALLQSILKHGYATFSDTADYWAMRSVGEMAIPTMRHSSALQLTGSRAAGEAALYRVFSLLSTEQKTALASGSPLSFGALRDEAREELSHLISHGTSTRFKRLDGSALPDGELIEPTEIFDPSSAMLAWKVVEEPVEGVVFAAEPGKIRFELRNRMASVPAGSTIVKGVNRTITWRILVGQGFVYESPMTEWAVPISVP